MGDDGGGRWRGETDEDAETGDVKLAGKGDNQTDRIKERERRASPYQQQ